MNKMVPLYKNLAKYQIQIQKCLEKSYIAVIYKFPAKWNGSKYLAAIKD